MAKASEVFKALPHVTEVWVTDDGEHHLHDANGGKKFTRAEKEADSTDLTAEKEADKKADSKAKK